MATGGLTGIAAVLAAGLMIQSPTKQEELTYSASDGCTHSPFLLVDAEWVCGDSVYLIKNNRREYAGAAKDIAPLPKPPPPAQKSSRN
jgi:hypothetical protein